MAISRFVEAVSKSVATKHEEVDRIPGTSKIRTYCADASLYSHESDLKNITRTSRYCNENSAKKR